MGYNMKGMILLALVVAISQVDGDCALRDLDRNPCEGELNCSGDFNPATSLIRDWSCRIRNVYYNYGQRRVRTDDDYNLYVKAENIDATNSFDAFGVINELVDHILTLSFNNGKMNSVPAAVYSVHKANTIDLSGNTLEILKLDSFSRMNSLRLLNMSCNYIADLEVGERSSGAGFSSVHTIDLSYNAISSIPNNYFRQFPDLTHLDLSHNYITSFDILTFEGITQLQNLYVSDNEITKLGVVFARFESMKELVLDHNYLMTIEGNNFDKMSKLEKLNISSNRLDSIENSAFDHLVELRELDLANNTINNITKGIFQNNTNLQKIDISRNKIFNIEPGAFEGKRIEEFKVHENPITGSLFKNTFQGICVDKLDLSGANVTELGPELFEGQFKSLNFSRNSISKIHKTTFDKLELLNELDLSHNQLQDIEFDTSNLKNLSYFYINNNNIKKITKVVFQCLTSLKIVDISNNAIENIETSAFENLKELDSLHLNNNPLILVFPQQMFSGLALTTQLDFTNTKINRIQDNAFNGMVSLKIFNSSYSNLSLLHFNLFNGTGSIEVIDLSNNQLKSFNLNNTNIRLVKDLYLQNNLLKNISDKTFSGLNNLRSLILKGNSLLNIDNESFRGLNNLLRLDLSNNKDVVFSSSILSNLQSLSVVLLDHITKEFSFESTTNTTISSIDLSFCQIVDINAVQVFQITKLERLNLATNNIEGINKTTFQKLIQLSWLSLSHNRLIRIQPGSFSDNEDLTVLDLSYNFLPSLQFGVFDGLVNLDTLDLTSNVLHSFSTSIFHNVPLVRVIYMDENLIDDIDFKEYSKTNIKFIYIGDNPIPCSSLTKLKKDTDVSLIVKAKNEKYDRENVDGITCKGMTKSNDVSQNNSNNDLARMLSRSLEEFRITVERLFKPNEPKVDIESNGFRNVSTSVEKFLEVFGKSETKRNDYLDKLMNINNRTNRALENIQEYMKMRDVVAVDSHIPQTDKPLNNDDIEKTIISMLSKEKQAMKNEIKTMFDDWKSHNIEKFGNNPFEVQSASDGSSTDLKSALYFIATCLAVLLCILVLSLIFVFFKLRNKHSYLSHSRQPMSSAMEME